MYSRKLNLLCCNLLDA